jgi:hypothetical protein
MNKFITESYLSEQKKLHENPNYGIASLLFSPIVADIIRQTGCKSVSDYGAGKKRLKEGLQQAGVDLSHTQYFAYDPVFPEYGEPRSADLICCIDVLEHIEPEFLDNTLIRISELITYIGFLSVHMGPANKKLADGRNAHLIQKPGSWWLPKISQYLEIIHLQSHEMMGSGIWMVVKPKVK